MQTTTSTGSNAETPEGGAAADHDAQHADGCSAVEGTRRRIRRLPPEVGAVLLTVGVAGVLLPGPVGTPLLLAGGLVLMPRLFGKMERWMERKFPGLHSHGMRYVDRFIDDFERRFPPPQAPAE